MSRMLTMFRTALAQRRAYHRALAEIAMIDERELADMRTDRGALIAGAYREAFGSAR